MRAALYIRVSTEDQVREGFSISAQKERLTAYAYSQEWQIVDYYADEGYSAKDINRPHLQRLIKDVYDKKIDVVLVHKLDRFTRSVKDLYYLLDEFDKNKCGFRSAQEQFDTTTSMGRAMMGMLGIFAQWERETIAQRVYIGMEQKHLTGKRNGAIAPIGYDKDGDDLIINQDAPLIRRIFKMYQDHQGVLSVARKLNREGYSFHYKSLQYILCNPVYCGRLRWNYRKDGKNTGNEIIVEGKHEPIISEEEYDAVQVLLNYRKNNGKAATSQYPFTVIMKCARCGGNMVGASRQFKDHRHKFYRCSTRVSFGTCDMPPISEEAVTINFLKKIKLNQKDIGKMFKEISISTNERTEIDELQGEISAIERRKKKWQFAFANDAITLEELKKNTQEDKLRESELRKQLERLPKVDEIQWTKEEAIELMTNIYDNWDAIDDDVAKKMWLNEIIDSIVVNALEKPRPHHTHELKLDLKIILKSI